MATSSSSRALRALSACCGRAAPARLRSHTTFASGLYKPFGIAFYPPGPSPQYLYVAENHRVVRYPYTDGMIAAASAPEVVVSDLPQGAGRLPGKGHWTRDVAFSGDGTTMFVSIGSFSNNQEDGEDETNRARILAYDPDGANGRVVAWGLRNPVSMSISPVTGALWTTNNERDELGRQSGARLRHRRAARRVLRLALVLYRGQSRSTAFRTPPERACRPPAFPTSSCRRTPRAWARPSTPARSSRPSITAACSSRPTAHGTAARRSAGR